MATYTVTGSATPRSTRTTWSVRRNGALTGFGSFDRAEAEAEADRLRQADGERLCDRCGGWYTDLGRHQRSHRHQVALGYCPHSHCVKALHPRTENHVDAAGREWEPAR